MMVMVVMIGRPLVTVAPWCCSLSAASEAGDVVADVVLGILGSNSCSTYGAIKASLAPKCECYKPNSISLA